MRIIFTVLGNSRRSNYLDGDTIRHGGGGASGTDTSNILIAEYLAAQGHEVVYCQDKLEPLLEQRLQQRGIEAPKGKNVRGVIYTDFQLSGINNNVFDILINNLWFEDYDSLPIQVTKAVIYWSHMQWFYGAGKLLEYAKKHNLAVGVVHVSEWEKSQTVGTDNFLEDNLNTQFLNQVIPNPVFDEIINKVLSENITRIKNKFIFHALWARGGNVAVKAVRELNIENKEFHAFDYLLAVHGWEDSFFKNHEGVDKHTLFKQLAESEYFLYPLYTPYQDVHKDTFSCVVAEALALGVKVITYPLGALPENFKDYCIFLDIPNGIEIEKIQSEALTKDFEGIFNDSKPFTEKVEQLINSNFEFDTQNARNYVLTNFNVETVGSKWVNFINKLI